MSIKEIFTQLSLWTLNLYLKSYIEKNSLILKKITTDPQPWLWGWSYY